MNPKRKEAIHRIVEQSVVDVQEAMDRVRVLEPLEDVLVRHARRETGLSLHDNIGRIVAYLIRKRLAALPLDDAATASEEDFK